MNSSQNLSYSQVRHAWCKAALIRLLRRWISYLAVGLFILGGAVSSAVAAMMAMAAAPVAPLFQAAQQPPIHGLVLTIGYALLGGMIVLSLSPWLWPRAWAQAERSLPIAVADRRGSDLTVVVWGLTPLFIVYTLGTAIWFIQFPAWFRHVWPQAVAMLVVSMGLSIVLGVAILEGRRHLLRGATSGRGYRPERKLSMRWPARRHYLPSTVALVLLPMVRGPAQRGGWFFAWTCAALVACAAALVATPRLAPWWLAAFAVLAQTMITWLNVVIVADLEPLHQGSVALPIRPWHLKWTRRAVALAPLVTGQIVLCAAICLAKVAIKPATFTTYLLASLLGNLALVTAASSTPVLGVQEIPTARVSWWLVVLVATLAIASEVIV